MGDCKAALNIAGQHFDCEFGAPHPGLAHANKRAEAIWCSDGEARRYGKARDAAG